MSIPFIDLKTQFGRVEQAVRDNIEAVLQHGRYIMGPEIQSLEERLAEYVGVKHAVACASGTDALLMALLALDIGPGDAVFTTPFTFVATVEVICLLGATPVFVDIDPVSYNIDPASLRKTIADLSQGKTPAGEAKLTPKAVIPVDLFGLAADYDVILAIAKEHGLAVIEDAAQSFGALYKGRRACSFGEIACTSFFPAKPLGCYGDGGMCFTDDAELYNRLCSVRGHGMGSHRYEHTRLGINGRLDSMQCGVLLAKFDIFPDEIERRQEVAARYNRLLAPAEGLVAPSVPEDCLSVWAQYTLRCPDMACREHMLTALKAADAPTAVYYPIPLHMQKAYAYLGWGAGDCPESEDAAGRVFSLPMHPYLKEEQQEQIAEAVLKAFAARPR